jgi:ketosteroid isomerase-like protein
MFKVHAPAEMNATFARAFNSRSVDAMRSLYEPGAVLLVDGSGAELRGHAAIAGELAKLLSAPGTMTSVNNLCVVHGDIALLRADFVLRDGETVIAKGSTAEIVRRQADGTWLYVIDHAAGGSVPAVLKELAGPG